MRPLRYSINISIDGCCDHRAGVPDEDTHRYATELMEQADAIILGRVTYELMENGWRPGKQSPEMKGIPDWMLPFGEAIDAVKKYVVSSTLEDVDWNAELIRGDIEQTVRDLKDQPGNGLYVGGVMLPLALAGWGLIDEYQFVVQPRLVGHGPTPFAGLTEMIDLKLFDRIEFPSGAVVLKYEPVR